MTDPRNVLLAGGLEPDGGGGIPVTHFKGRMVDFDASEVTPNEGRTYTRVTHKANELQVIATNEPFNFDSIEFFISASAKEKSLWGVWVASVARVVGVDIKEPRPDGSTILYQELFDTHLRGQVVEIKRTGGHKMPRQEDGKWVQKDVDAWELFSVEGGAITAEDKAIELLVSSADMPSFMRAAVVDQTIGSDKALFAAIQSGSFPTDMVAKGKITGDAGNYSKV